jgi:hypothetical protein
VDGAVLSNGGKERLVSAEKGEKVVRMLTERNIPEIVLRTWEKFLFSRVSTWRCLFMLRIGWAVVRRGLKVSGHSRPRLMVTPPSGERCSHAFGVSELCLCGTVAGGFGVAKRHSING